MKLARPLVGIFLLCFGANLEGQDEAAVSPALRPVLLTFCQDCHGPSDQQGGFRVDELSTSLSDSGDFADWLAVYRKLEAGEMPPKGEPRPKPARMKEVLTALRSGLLAADRARQKREGRTVLRRLNRFEYENTIRDLLAIDVDLKELLPEDTSAHGFDNIGEALNVSSVLLERYLEAADNALDAAIVTGARPETRQGRYSYLDERRVKDHKSYKKLDDALVFFSAGYSPTEINQFSTKAAGEHRVRVSAYAHQSDGPVTFRVYGADDAGTFLAGYFDAVVKPTVHEMTVRLGFRKTIRVVPYGTRITQWNQAASEKGPGLAVQWVEIEGPLIDLWPPESLSRVYGELPFEVVNAEEMKRNRRLKPVREAVSTMPLSDAKTLLERFLSRAFRRPVSEKTLQSYLDLVETQLDAGLSFHNAIRFGLKAALCSPDFLYLQEPAESGGELDDFQLASRLSYFLWSTLPDEELLNLARAGELRESAVLRKQTERLVNDPRCRALTENFLGQWLDLREIDFTTPDRVLYPEFDELLKISMVRETELFFEELLKKDLSVSNFIDSEFAILNGRLARHYGIENVKGQAFRSVPLKPESNRGGVLTQASVLKVTANGTNTSPVLRGVWLLEKLIGEPVPPPPANVPAVEPDIRGATSIRDQLAKHRANESCSTCHRRIDPAGFALENFDVIGGWRDNYRSVGEGQTVDTQIDGRRVRYKRGPEVDSGDVQSDGRRFGGIAEFKKLLLEDKDQIARAVTEKLVVYSTGSPIQFADTEEVNAIVKRASAKEHGLRTLIHEVVQSRLFRSK